MIEAKWSLKELAEAIFLKQLSVHAREFRGLSTDSRENMSGALFWCLVGEAHDAHAFVAQAVERGAAGVVVHKVTPEIEKLCERVTVLLVPDTLLALQELARSHRRQLKAPVVGITGSNGKTSTKEFAAHLISAHRRVHWSKGSFNNHWGVPFTLLACPLDAEVVLVEMGMNHEGEIQRLCEIAEPDIVLCTLVGKTHIEHFGTVDKIAKAKREIYEFSPKHALRLFNEDNEWTRRMWTEFQARQGEGDSSLSTWSGQRADAPIHLRVTSESFDGLKVEGQISGVSGEAVVPILGAYHINNLMAAASIAVAVGLTPQEVWQSLPRCQGAWGRMQLLRGRNDIHVLFDGYNASPDSMAALIRAIPSLQSLSGAQRVFAVLGEMRELGQAAADEHQELGKLLGKTPVAGLWFYGPSQKSFAQGLKDSSGLSEFPANFYFTEDYDEVLAQRLAAQLKTGDLLVVKGSRGMKTERVVRLLADLPQKD